jgi:hypothetical protein
MYRSVLIRRVNIFPLRSMVSRLASPDSSPLNPKTTAPLARPLNKIAQFGDFICMYAINFVPLQSENKLYTLFIPS